MIYITGDTHGKIDISKLNSKNFPQQKVMTKNDYVIITGDFGFVWNNDKEDLYWRKWLDNKNFTTLFVDGNHENHDLLDEYPVEIWNGGKVHKISDSIIHLMRGQVFTIDDKKIFTFGGAKSHDKIFRKIGISWWEREMPNKIEMEEGLENLQKHNYEVDYIVTHTTSINVIETLCKYFSFIPENDDLTSYFNFLNKEVKYKHWYFGHFHKDLQILDNQTVLYKKIYKI